MFAIPISEDSISECFSYSLLSAPRSAYPTSHGPANYVAAHMQPFFVMLVYTRARLRTASLFIRTHLAVRSRPDARAQPVSTRTSFKINLNSV